MPRYRLTVEYDGGPYKGFQAQDGVASVQDSLERAILGFSGERLRLQAAGRTDTGVHATGQVIHFDLTKDWRADVVRDAMNAHLAPEPISILSAQLADDDFHARFSATGRRYLYRILDRRSPAALERARVWWVKTPLDGGLMHAAADVLIGTHDFTTFRDTHCQSKSPVKTLDQVRSIVGSLAEVGVGRWSAERLAAALAAADRSACGPVAPAHGLYLTGVTYGALQAATTEP
jgi:tRNA pseudouridine38-40 synthase